MKKTLIVCLMVYFVIPAGLGLAEVHGYFWLGGIGVFLDYTEKENGATLDRDHGWLPGVDSGLFLTERNWVLRFQGKWAYTNNATYNGQTDTRVPLNFDHEYETIWTIEANVGYTFHAPINFTPYIGLGYRRWSRGKAQRVQAEDGNYVWDYKEVYKWGYVPVGIILEKPFFKNRFEVELDTAILFPFSQDMTAYLSETDPAYSDVGFDLGWRPGFRIKIPIRWYYTKTAALYISPFYRFWRIGRSNTVEANGGSYYEPRSTTHYYGVSCGLTFQF